jgi:hypothetical protein
MLADRGAMAADAHRAPADGRPVHRVDGVVSAPGLVVPVWQPGQTEDDQ